MIVEGAVDQRSDQGSTSSFGVNLLNDWGQDISLSEFQFSHLQIDAYWTGYEFLKRQFKYFSTSVTFLTGFIMKMASNLSCLHLKTYGNFVLFIVSPNWFVLYHISSIKMGAQVYLITLQKRIYGEGEFYLHENKL